MVPTLRVDDDVYEELKSHAEPFVDTPNSVLRRLLGLDSAPSEIAGPTNMDEVDNERPPEPPAVVPQQPRGRTARRRGGKGSAKRTRAPAGALLPEDDYEVPLLRALDELGGSAPSRQVIDRVGELLKDSLTDLDRDTLPSGGIRWQSRVQFVRLRLIQQGLMLKETGRGIWAVSDAGRSFLAGTDKEAVGQ